MRASQLRGRGVTAVGWRFFEWTNDPGGWNDLVFGLPYPHLLQSWEWGALQERFGWQVRRFALELDGHPRGAASIQIGRASLPYRRAFFYIPRGPQLADADAEGWREWLPRVRDLAVAEGALAVRVEPESRDIGSLLRREGYRPDGHVQPLASQVIDLRPAREQIRASFKPKTRYNLGLAERRGVTVEQSEDVDVLVRLLAATARRQSIHLQGPDYLKALLALVGPRARIYVARVDRSPLAAILVARFGPTAYYLYGGDSQERRELMPNYLLHWVALSDAQRDGCRHYDLWGVPEEAHRGHPWYGLYQFKVGFGGETVRYLGTLTLALHAFKWRMHRAAEAGRRMVRHFRDRVPV